MLVALTIGYGDYRLRESFEVSDAAPPTRIALIQGVYDTVFGNDEETDGTLDLEASDSDVRLDFDDSMFDSDPDIASSDSDVQLDGDSELNLEEDAGDVAGSGVLDFSDEADALVADSDSDVNLVAEDSDSDVTIVAEDANVDWDGAEDGTDPEIFLAEESSDVDEMDVSSNDSSLILMGGETAADVELASSLFAEDDDFPEEDSVLMSDSDGDIPMFAESDSHDSSEDVSGADSESDAELAEVDIAESDESSYLLPGVDADSDEELVADGALSDSAMFLGGIDSESDVNLVDSADSLQPAEARAVDRDVSSRRHSLKLPRNKFCLINLFLLRQGLGQTVQRPHILRVSLKIRSIHRFRFTELMLFQKQCAKRVCRRMRTYLFLSINTRNFSVSVSSKRHVKTEPARHKPL